MTTKVCPRCQVEKSTDEFNKASRRDGFQTYCRLCHNSMQRSAYDDVQRDKRRVRESKRKMLKPDAKRNAEYLRNYGITVDDYNLMYDKQGGVCAICADICKTKKMLCVDHSHETGKVRGLLCMPCNAAIGMMYDDPSLLYRAAEYLRPLDFDDASM